MSWWDRAINGPAADVPVRRESTPSRGSAQWYPTPQYQPSSRQDDWSEPGPDPVQQQNMEISQDVLDFMGDTGTYTYGKSGSVVETRSDGTTGSVQASPMFLRDMPEDIDPGMLSIADKHEWLWQRTARAPLRGKSKALRAEPNRCPECGDARFFERKSMSKGGMPPAPICMACGYTGDSIHLSTLN